MKKLLSLFPFLILFLFSCTNFQNTTSVTLALNGRDIARSAARDVEPISKEEGYYVTAAIRGDFNQAQTAFISAGDDECIFTFDYVPLNSEVYAEINIFQSLVAGETGEPSYDSKIQKWTGKSETITVSPGENYLSLELNPLTASGAFEQKDGNMSFIILNKNGSYFIQISDGGIISEGLWRCSEAFDENTGPFRLEESFTLYLTENVYGKLKFDSYATMPVIVELPEEQAINVKYDGNTHSFSFEGKSGYKFVLGDENGGDPPGPITYDVSVHTSDTSKGTITASPDNNITPGTEVTVTVTPNSGYKIQNLFIDYQPVDLSEIVNGKYTFTMPESNVNISAAFEQIQIPADFVLVTGGILDDTYGNTPESNVFVEGRSVEINHFYMCEHEVTKSEYETYCRYSGSSIDINASPNKAVYYVSWYDAIVYCNLRSKAEGRDPVYSIGGKTDPSQWDGKQVTGSGESAKYCGPATENTNWNNVSYNSNANGYRLPTEVEWEYAARGGSADAEYTYSGGNEANKVAVYGINFPTDVKTMTPNDLGLYDMSGNAREWCWDKSSSAGNVAVEAGTGFSGPTDGSYRVYRGGDCTSENMEKLSVYYRSAESPHKNFSNTGFRVVLNKN